MFLYEVSLMERAYSSLISLNTLLNHLARTFETSQSKSLLRSRSLVLTAAKAKATSGLIHLTSAQREYTY